MSEGQNQLVKSFYENEVLRLAVGEFLIDYLKDRALNLDTGKNNSELGEDFRSLKTAEKVINEGFNEMAKFSQSTKEKVAENQAV